MKNLIRQFFLTSTFVGIGYNASKFTMFGIRDTKETVDNLDIKDEKQSYFLYGLYGIPICMPYVFYGSILGGIHGLFFPILLPCKYIYKNHIKE